MRRIIIILAATATLAGCASLPDLHTTQPPPATVPACTGSVVVIYGDEQLGCDMTPPQRLDVLDVPVQECLDMGGTLRPDPDSTDGNVDCEDVGY